MEFLIDKITQNLNEKLIQITISNPRKAEEIKKYNIRPILVKEKLLFQLAAYTKTQVFHENLEDRNLMDKLVPVLPLYRQVQMQTMSGEMTALINKKGKAAIKIGKKIEAEVSRRESSVGDLSRLQHNRTKHYILQEGIAVPFLQDLGVMNGEGKIVKSHYDKFRQINRFLEFIEDILEYLPKDREITILDFGCGKSYLTFAMYYYLKELQGYPIRIIGLDLKKKVIADCSRLAQKYGYENLHFYEGSIENFEGVSHVDMVVTLHACDTATDYAMYKAINWDADVILSVPCCQHELNGQIEAEQFSPIMDYGILKERFCAMATDGIRGEILEAMGYETQILEFIDIEHTPKNLMVRGVKKKKKSREKLEEVKEFCTKFHFQPTLLELTDNNFFGDSFRKASWRAEESDGKGSRKK